jgi:hypothetical protein
VGLGSDGQDGAAGEAVGALGDGAHEQALEPAAAVRADDHEVGVEVGRELRDLAGPPPSGRGGRGVADRAGDGHREVDGLPFAMLVSVAAMRPLLLVAARGARPRPAPLETSAAPRLRAIDERWGRPATRPSCVQSPRCGSLRHAQETRGLAG